MERAQRAQRILAWLVQLGALAQFFLAGYAVFRAKPHGTEKLFHSSSFDAHRGLGYALILVAFALFVLAIVNRQQVRLTFVLFIVTGLQLVLARWGGSAPVLGGLHGLNGLAVLALSHVAARGPRRAAEEPVERTPVAAD